MPASHSRRIFLKWMGAATLSALLPSCRSTPSTTFGPSARLKNEAHLFKNTADYTYLWWANGLRHPDLFFNIQTSRYGLSFDARRCRLLRLGRIDNPPGEAAALTEDNRRIDDLPRADLTAWVETGGKRFAVEASGRTSDDYQLIESGRNFARRWQTFLTFEPGAPGFGVESGLEISAWPDRLAFVLRLEPSEVLEQASFGLTFTAPEGYEIAQDQGSVTLTGPGGQGFVALPARPDLTLTCDPAARACTLSLPARQWAAGEAQTAGLVFYPVSQPGVIPAEVEAQGTEPLQLKAAQVAPEPRDLEVQYQPETGWYVVALRNDGVSESREANNRRIERVKVSVHNPGTQARAVRLNFQKEGQVFGIVGISAMLRDPDGNPMGIPVQISKNWHSGRAIDESKRFEGPWYRALTMLEVPPGETLSFEYTSVNALWGGLPAASHAQLCLVGWGSNHLWEEAAIGAWGENLCFEPDQGQSVGAVLDTRPLMVWAMEPTPRQKWGWTNNVGGADFLVYYDRDVEKQWNSRMKTRHARNGPNLTEVTYAGTSHDRKIDLQYTVSLYRTDDITRGVYRFRYDVKEKVEFTRLILFQCGGDDYSYTGERKFAYGNEKGLTQEWQTQWGSGQYRTERMELTGEAPWVSMHEAVSRDITGNGAWANRGLVVRHWEAVLGGKACRPWIAERGIFVAGADTSIIDFLPPTDVKELQPGDTVEAEIVHVVVPQFAQDYYGPNQNLARALEAGQDTWKMILREAAGNHLEVKVTQGGTLERSYPIQIRAAAPEVIFEVTGGLAYVPATLRGLDDYRGWRLEVKDGSGWKKIDQSDHGGDYWQADFDAQAQGWDITYSLSLDTPQDTRQTRTFRLVRDAS